MLALLDLEGLLVEDEVVEDRGVENALKHNDVADDLARQERILQFLVRNKVIKPLLAEARHSTHLEEVRRLEAGHLAAPSRR